MTPTDSSEDGEKGRINVDRRTMLSMLGAGTVGSAALWRGFDSVGVGSAQETGTEFGRCEPCIDSYSGYLMPAARGMATDGTTDGDGANETQPDAGNETGTNETGTNATGTNETTGNETAGTGDPAEAFDPVATVELRVDDADVVFQDGETEETLPEDGDPEAGNETAPENGNETAPAVGNETGPDAENETGAAAGDNETTGNATVNETTGGEGDEGEGGPPGGPEQGAFPDFYFDPVGVRLRPGDVVAFDVISELHTVTAYHPRFFGVQQRVPDGVPGFTSPPIVDGDTWYYRFEEPGVYDMQCLPHEGLGMVMRAVVLEEGADVPEGYETSLMDGQAGANETEPGAEAGNETGPDVGNETGPDTGNETDPGVGNDTDPGAGNETEPGVGNETADQGDVGGTEPQPGGIPPSEIALKVLSASELTPENIVDQETVAWTDLTGVESEPPF